jgi:hypothetical protein
MARKYVLISCCVLVAACSSRETTPYTVAADGFAAMAVTFASEGYEVTAPQDIPPDTAPSATYDGYILLDASSIWSRESYAGEMALEAEFASDTVTGAASNLYDSSGRAVAGSLVISGGLIDRAAAPLGGGQILGNLDGVLTDADGVDLTVESTLVGDFYGPDAEGYRAVIEGTMSSADYGEELLQGRSIGLK